jgi:hypothetical protein
LHVGSVLRRQLPDGRRKVAKRKRYSVEQIIRMLREAEADARRRGKR